ncbi:hypothetical protein GOBAR_DD05947 [Gossypium barbadense]|nr:hypothetical protein GOBAR_DD05947 [Gossypium barbadense]
MGGVSALGMGGRTKKRPAIESPQILAGVVAALGKSSNGGGAKAESYPQWTNHNGHQARPDAITPITIKHHHRRISDINVEVPTQ